jgi:hypothetical protein
MMQLWAASWELEELTGLMNSEMTELTRESKTAKPSRRDSQAPGLRPGVRRDVRYLPAFRNFL